MSSKFFIVCLLIVIVSSVTFGQESERKCVPGKTYNDGCNTCFCTETQVIGCTLMACQERDPETGEFRPAKVLDPPEDFWETPE